MSGLLIFILKSTKLAAISLVSNVIPVAMAFGLWGWVNGFVDLGITVTFGIAFGIVVDDTIHFLSKYQRARRELGYGTEAAISYAFSTVGVALLVTSVVLIAGFSMLGFSDMNITANMAILTTVTIAFAFMVDFFLVPGLLLIFDKDKSECSTSNSNTPQ
jgi:predicted RND superfamily exporter protein